MGTFQKVVWPRGKDLKPQPKGRAAQPSIPTSTRPLPETVKAERAERKRLVDLQMYPRGERLPVLMPLPDEPPELLSFNRTWLQKEQQERVQRLSEAMCLRNLREPVPPMTATEVTLRLQEYHTRQQKKP